MPSGNNLVSLSVGTRLPVVTLFSIGASITDLRTPGFGFNIALNQLAYSTYSEELGFLDAGDNTPPVREASIACSLGIAINFP